MNNRLDGPEREVAQQEVIRLTNTGVQLADLALNNLEFRANPQVLQLNQSRLNRLEQTDVDILSGISERFSGVTSNPEVLNTYTLAQFQTDFLYLAQFFSNPQRREMELRIREVSTEEFAELQAQWTAAMANAARLRQEREAQGVAMERSEETPGLGLRRIELLAAPDLNVASAVQAVRAQIESEGLNNEQAMQRFRALLLPNVVERLGAWAQNNDRVVRRHMQANNQTGEGAQSEAEILEQITGITTMGESVVGDVVQGGLNLAGNLGGDIASALQYEFIENDPLLGRLFQDSPLRAVMMADLFDGDFDANLYSDKIAEQLESLFPDNLEFSRITEQFGTWAGLENEELTPEMLHDIKAKLETIPRFFIGGEWEDRYHEYVRNEIAGKGAMDFPEWILTQVSGIQRILFSFLVNPMVVTAMNWWLNDSEDEDIDRYGEHWNLYNSLDPNAEDPEADPDVTPGRLGDTDAEALVEVSEVYADLLERYRANVNDPDAVIDIQINGEPLGTENWRDFETELSNINALITSTPNASPLLAKGLRIQDLNFLALHNGDENTPEDGINAYFEADGSLRMNYEFGAWLTGAMGIGNGIDGMREMDAVMSVGGFAGAIAGFRYGIGFPGGLWGKVIGVAVGTIGGWTGPRLVNWDVGFAGISLDIAAINVDSLATAIREIQDDVGALEDALGEIDLEAFANIYPALNDHRDKFNLEDIEANGGVPTSLLTDNGSLSPAFISFLEIDDPTFWDGYQMTRADLELFADNLDTGIFNFNAIDDNEDAIERRNPWFRPEGYYVDGSNLIFEERVENAAGLFAWIRS